MDNPIKEARIELLYDIEAIVNESNPDKTTQIVHNIKPAKYLTLQESDKVFPSEYFNDNTIIVLPTDQISQPTNVLDYDEDQIKLDELNIGDKYPLTLIMCAHTIEVSTSPMFVQNSCQRINVGSSLSVRNIDDLIRNSKEHFASILESNGIDVNKDYIYLRIAMYENIKGRPQDF
ncbi:MAG: hypothetical protein ACMXYG_06245 [Candidatus Woesearchaeota archaeon]